MVTPRILPHALERCHEMGISTKVAKRIIRNADLTRPSSDGLRIAVSDADPDYAVVYYPGSPPVVVTVVFRTYDLYVRQGATFRSVS